MQQNDNDVKPWILNYMHELSETENYNFLLDLLYINLIYKIYNTRITNEIIKDLIDFSNLRFSYRLNYE